MTDPTKSWPGEGVAEDLIDHATLTGVVKFLKAYMGDGWAAAKTARDDIEARLKALEAMVDKPKPTPIAPAPMPPKPA